MMMSTGNIFGELSPSGLARVAGELVTSEVAAVDPLGPEVRQAAVYLLARMAFEHRDDDLGPVSTRIANLLQLDVPDPTIRQGKTALNRALSI